MILGTPRNQKTNALTYSNAKLFLNPIIIGDDDCEFLTPILENGVKSNQNRFFAYRRWYNKPPSDDDMLSSIALCESAFNY